MNDAESRKQLPWGCIGMVIVGLAFLIALLWPTIHRPGRHRRPSCTNDLKQIGLALNNYNSALDSFSPAVMLDSSGRRVHGWRMILKPYYEGATGGPYSLALPWDAPVNAEVAKAMRDALHCPLEENPRPGETSYVAVVGPGFLFDGDKAVKPADVTDGLSNTIAVVEVAGSGILWNEPRDMIWDEFLKRVNSNSVSAHEGGFNALFADGSVHFIQDSIDRQRLHAWFTVAGGEDLDGPYGTP